MSAITQPQIVALSTSVAEPRQRRLAGYVVGLSTIVFVLLLPFVRTQLSSVAAFIPIYETAVILVDLITAVLLIGQFHAVQSRVLLILSSGYLFTASSATFHLLSFPGLFDQTGMLHGGPQTTAWLYMFWHGGFPLFVIVYAWLKSAKNVLAGLSTGAATALCILAPLALSSGLAMLATVGHDLLPTIMLGNRHSSIMTIVVATVWLFHLAALIVLWFNRPHSVIDLWLMVVMVVLLFDIALSAVLNGGRFDLGFYSGRIFGLLAVSFILIVLLLEHGVLYAKLTDAYDELHRLATADPLTGIANRRAFESTLEQEWRRAIRANVPLSLLMIDVDHFKMFNDNAGHVMGDQCLREVASVLSDSLKRAGDFAARYGGEEFVVVLPDTAPDAAIAMAERLSQAIDARFIAHPASPVAEHVTISIGATTLLLTQPDGGKPTLLPVSLVEAADRALYAAKEAGRHRVHGNTLAAGQI